MGAKLGGGGGSKFELGQNSDINVTPFVDVMLVLLIIFMVSAPIATKFIKIDMPPPTPDSPTPERDPVMINVYPYGEIFIGDVPTTLDTLVSDVSNALAVPQPKEETILIRADRYTPYKDFMNVLNVLQYNGYLNISLIAENL